MSLDWPQLIALYWIFAAWVCAAYASKWIRNSFDSQLGRFWMRVLVIVFAPILFPLLLFWWIIVLIVMVFAALLEWLTE